MSFETNVRICDKIIVNSRLEWRLFSANDCITSHKRHQTINIKSSLETSNNYLIFKSKNHFFKSNQTFRKTLWIVFKSFICPQTGIDGQNVRQFWTNVSFLRSIGISFVFGWNQLDRQFDSRSESSTADRRRKGRLLSSQRCFDFYDRLLDLFVQLMATKRHKHDNRGNGIQRLPLIRRDGMWSQTLLRCLSVDQMFLNNRWTLLYRRIGSNETHFQSNASEVLFRDINDWTKMSFNCIAFWVGP